MEKFSAGSMSKEISEWVKVAETDQFEKSVRRKVVALADSVSILAGTLYRITHRPRVLVNSIKEGILYLTG